MVGNDETGHQNGEWGQVSHGDVQANVMGDYAIVLKTVLFAVVMILMVFIILFKTTRVIPAEKVKAAEVALADNADLKKKLAEATQRAIEWANDSSLKQRQIDAQDRKIKGLQTKLAAKEREIAQAQSRADKAQVQATRAEAKNAGLQQKSDSVARLQRENAELRQQLQNERGRGGFDTDYAMQIDAGNGLAKITEKNWSFRVPGGETLKILYDCTKAPEASYLYRGGGSFRSGGSVGSR